MKSNRAERPSDGFNFKQHSRNIRNVETRPPTITTTTARIKKLSPPRKNTRLGANDATLNDLFAASHQQAKKTPFSKTHPPVPKKIEKLKKCAPKRPNTKPSLSLMKNVARIHKDTLDLGTDTKSTTKCPYCHETLISNNGSSSVDTNKGDEQLQAKLPPILQLELDKIMEAEEKYQKERKDQQQQLHMEHLPKRRFVSNMDQFRFCQLHRLELNVKPEGIRLGYPIDLDFTELGARVASLRLELEKVINGEIDSPYRTIALAAYKDMGLHKARDTMGVMARFEKTMPGYYGSKGASIIMNKINDMLLLTGFITKDKTHPQLPLEYIQQVLVPETGSRLIQQDLIKKGPGTDQTMENARQVMANSVDFGSKMYPAEDEEALCPVEYINDKDNDNGNGNGNDTDTSEDGDHGEKTEILEYLSSDNEQG